jgi:hypothetical protein
VYIEPDWGGLGKENGYALMIKIIFVAALQQTYCWLLAASHKKAASQRLFRAQAPVSDLSQLQPPLYFFQS